MNLPRLQIRCPYCLKEGSARGELLNQRITCKHCANTFRAVPAVGDPTLVAPAPMSSESSYDGSVSMAELAIAPARETPRQRIDALEGEIRQLQAELTAVRRQAVALAASQTAGAGISADVVADLRLQLSMAREATANAQAELAAEEKTHAASERELLRDVVSFRKQLDQAHDNLSRAGQPQPELVHELATLRKELAEVKDALDQEREARRQAEQTLDASRTDLGNAHAEEARYLRGQIDQLGLDLQAAESQIHHGEIERADALESLSKTAEDHRGQAERNLQELHETRVALEAARVGHMELEASHTEQTQALRDQIQTLLAEQQSTRQALEAQLDARSQAHQSDRESMVAELYTLRQELEAGQSDLARTHLEQIERLQAEHHSHREQLEVGHADQIQTHRAELEALRAELQTAVDRAEVGQNDQTQALEALRVEHQSTRAQLEAGHAEQTRLYLEQLESLRGEHQSTRAQLEAGHAEETRLYLDQIEALHGDHHSTREQLEAGHAEQTRLYLDQIEAVRDEIQTTREQLQAGHAEQTWGHLAELEALRSAHETARQQIEVEKAAELASLQAHLAQVQAELAGHALTGQERDEARALLDSRIEETRTLQGQLEAAQTHAASLLAKVQEAEALSHWLEEAQAEVTHHRNRAEEADELRGKLDALQVEAEGHLARAREADDVRVRLEALQVETEDLNGKLQATRIEADEHRSRSEKADELQALLDALKVEADDHRSRAEEAGVLRGRLEDLQTEAAEHRKRAQEADELQSKLEALQAETNHHRSRAEEAEVLRSRLETLQAEAAEHRSKAEEADVLRARLEALHVEAASQRSQLKEAETLRERLEAAEAELAAFQADRQEQAATPFLSADEIEQLREERDKARAEIDQLRQNHERQQTDLISSIFDFDHDGTEEETSAMLADLAEDRLYTEKLRQKAELDSLKKAIEQAKAEAEVHRRAADDLARRVKQGESAKAQTRAQMQALSVDAVAIEAERRRSVEEAVKATRADFDRKLSETQARLKVATSRAEVLESEAREVRQQLAAIRKQGDRPVDSEADVEFGSSARVATLNERATARLTWPEAESRLALARQIAIDRKDRTLLDKISQTSDKVRADLNAREDSLAENTVRGAEIEVGLDPGGWSIQGLKIFRPNPAIVSSLAALAPSFDRVMRQGDADAIRSTVTQMRSILGDQAGLPNVRRAGRVPGVRQRITPEAAVRLFLDALESEQWLIRPLFSNRPLSESSLSVYAGLVGAACEVRSLVSRHVPDRLGWLDRVIEATTTFLASHQQTDGHFPFLDPRGKPSPLATAVEAMVAARPQSVKDGWVVGIDPIGQSQIETAACGTALSRAGAALGNADWSEAAIKAADWATGQPGLPQFVANAATVGLLARLSIDAGQQRHLNAMISRVSLSLLPGQVENGRWIDPSAAQTTNHLTILRALQDAWEAIPASILDVRFRTYAGVDRAFASLLDEMIVLGISAQGVGLRELIRHRDLYELGNAPRLDGAILDAATVVQELCHEGLKPRLGVAPEQLAALTRL